MKNKDRNQFQMKGDERDMTIVKYTARHWAGSCTEGNFPVNYHLTTGEA